MGEQRHHCPYAEEANGFDLHDLYDPTSEFSFFDRVHEKDSS
jgi:hypothetical protein